MVSINRLTILSNSTSFRLTGSKYVLSTQIDQNSDVQRPINKYYCLEAKEVKKELEILRPIAWPRTNGPELLESPREEVDFQSLNLENCCTSSEVMMEIRS